MLLGDAHTGASSSSSSSHTHQSYAPPPRDLHKRMARMIHKIGFFLCSMVSRMYRQGVRGCWSDLRRLVCNCPSMQWLSITGPSRRLSASMDFIEQFRQGPETQSEWNLLLWRVTFPMIALLIFTFLAVLGKFGHRLYSFLVCPVWYFSQFVLVAHPFLLVFKFQESDAVIRKRIWQVLAILSLAISLMEWFLSSPPDAAPSSSLVLGGPSSAFAASIRARFLRHSWIVANTIFGIVVLVAIPRYFFLQKRTIAKDTAHDSLSGSPSATALFMPLSPVSAPSTPAPSPARTTTTTPPTSSGGASSSSTSTSNTNNSSSSRLYSSIMVSSATSIPVSASASAFAMQQRRARSAMILTASCAVLVWIAMMSSYSSIKNVDVISKYWFTIYLLSPIACALLIYVLRGGSGGSQSSSNAAAASFDYVAIYSAILVHLPVFLGHLCFRLFTIVELADPAHPAHAEARGIDFAGATGSGSGVNFSASTSWIKLGISIVYLLVMQTYFYVMTQVVNAMAEPFAHPSLLYLGQLYYYLFWYVLVGSDTPIDALYWGMLLVNNVHIAFLNTGIYADFKQSSTTCFSAAPFLMQNVHLFRGSSSVAMCFRATTVMMVDATAKSSAALCRTGAADPQGKKEPPVAVAMAHGRRNGGGDGDDDATVMMNTTDLEDATGGAAADSSVAGTTTVKRTSRRQSHSGLLSENGDAIQWNAISDDPASNRPVRKSPSPSPKNTTTMWTSRNPWTSMFAAFGGGRATAAAASPAMPSSPSSATIYFTQCTCGQQACSCSGKPMASGLNEPPYQQQPLPLLKPSSTTEQLRPLYFLMKLAEQDNMADTTALILVPSLLTLLAVLDKPSHGLAILVDQMNLWIRCICMFAGRMGGAYLAREIFTYKLRARLRTHQTRRSAGTGTGTSGPSSRAIEEPSPSTMLSQIEGVSTRMWIQRLMLQDFHRHFWYLTIVTIVVTFACFERMEVPARFALLTP